MVELHITHTSKGYSPREPWRHTHHDVESFPDMTAAKAWLRDRYGKSKRVPMYRDRQGGTPIKVGYVIGYRGEDQDRSAADGVYRYLGQDWIEFWNVDRSRPEGI